MTENAARRRVEDRQQGIEDRKSRAEDRATIFDAISYPPPSTFNPLGGSL